VTTLDALGAEAAACTACTLAETRTTVVFGTGTADARLMFVGEAPGRDEDLAGEPFVGRAGQLLTSLIEEIGLSRSDVYIANVLKCRPPGNRDPRPAEIDACKGYLRTQIDLVDPEVVMTLGNFATKLLLRTETGITRMRGRVYPWWRGMVVPTFHPAAVLRNPARMDDVRADFDLARRVLSGELTRDQARS
jgi:uracil-DNA glycosylase family 4